MIYIRIYPKKIKKENITHKIYNTYDEINKELTCPHCHKSIFFAAIAPASCPNCSNKLSYYEKLFSTVNPGSAIESRLKLHNFGNLSVL